MNAAKLFRRVLPGDDRYGDPLSTAGEGLPGRVGRAVADLRAERPSALRELSLGALQAWQAMAEAQNRGRGAIDVAILFTDLAGFSSWALSAGDTATLELLRGVGAAEEHAVTERGGTIVKRLGDGAMAVFVDPRQAVEAALELQRELSKIQVAGYVPQLRAGVHVGRPQGSGATTSAWTSTWRRGSATPRRRARSSCRTAPAYSSRRAGCGSAAGAV